MLYRIIEVFFSFIQQYLIPYKCIQGIIDFLYKLRSLWLHPLFRECHYTVKFGGIGRLYGTKNISVGAHSCFGDDIYLTTYEAYSCSVRGENVLGNLIRDTKIPGCYKQKMTPNLQIGNNCWFGAYNHISCCNRIIIKDNLLTGKFVTINDNNHGSTERLMLDVRPSSRPITSKGGIIIEENVWIGEKATILGGVYIGKGAIIGANAVVTKDVPPYSVVVGNPAHVITKY